MSDVVEFTKLDLKDAANWGDEEDKLMKAFVEFVLKFSKHCAPTETLVAAMKNAQKDAFESNKKQERDNDFPCMFEYLSKSDIAWSIQCVDSNHIGWIHKRCDPGNKALKYAANASVSQKHDGKYTSGDDIVEESGEGIKLYEGLLGWVQETLMVPSAGFTKVRKYCNARAKELNILQPMKESQYKTNKRSYDELVESGAKAPKLVFSRRDLVPGMDSRLTNYAEI